MVFRKLDRAWWLGAALILGLGACVYWPSLFGGQLWDDNTEIFLNPALRSWRGLIDIWTGATGPDYFPLKSTIEWLQWHCWGDWVLGYHATSLACHLASALLFWRLLDRLIGRRTWAAWLAAALFTVHPLALESVAWMAELKNTLSLPFLLLSALAYVRAEEEPASRGTYCRAVAWFAAALLCKTSVVMFPVVLLLFALWRSGRISSRAWMRTLPFFGLSLGLGAVTWWFQRHRAIADLPVHLGGGRDRLVGAGRALWEYYLLVVSPFGHQTIYPAAGFHLPLAWLVLGLAPVIFALLALPARGDWRRTILLGTGFFVLNLLPVAGLLAMSYLRIAPLADHFLYLPALGLIGLAAAGAAAPRSRAGKTGAAVVLSLYVAVAAAQTRALAADYANEERFWTVAANRNPDSWLAQNNLGSALLSRRDATDALKPLGKARQLRPDAAEVTANLASALLQMGDVPRAMAAGEDAVRSEPQFATGHYNLANALMAAGRQTEALEHYRTAVRLEPESVEFHYNLGNALADAGDLAGAALEFGTAGQLAPDDFACRLNLGNVLAAQDKMPEAVAAFRTAVALQPDSADAHYCLADALMAMRSPAEAIVEYQAALQLKPSDPAIAAALARARQ